MNSTVEQNNSYLIYDPAKTECNLVQIYCYCNWGVAVLSIAIQIHLPQEPTWDITEKDLIIDTRTVTRNRFAEVSDQYTKIQIISTEIAKSTPSQHKNKTRKYEINLQDLLSSSRGQG